MVTLAQWVEDVRGHLDGDRSEEGNQLDAPYTAGSGTITLRYALGGINVGSIVSVGANTMRVMAINPLTKQATVIAGWQGSTDANASIGDLVRVNPRFTDYRIVRAIGGSLRTLSSPTAGLYKVGSLLISGQDGIEGYDLAGVSNLLRVLEVRRQAYGSTLAWPRVPASEWDVKRTAPTADFPSGNALRVWSDDVASGYQLEVIYAAAFTATTNLTDDVSTTGIPSTADDIPPLGATLNLMAGREVTRNAMRSQPDARKATEVGPGSVAASANGLRQYFAQRVQEEAARLRQQYPVGR